jgi:hypothetical protein
MKTLNEEVNRIKSIMGLIFEEKEVDKEEDEESNVESSETEVIKGSYSAEGKSNTYDALHSFNRRKSDGFGGGINSKVAEGIKQYKQSKGLKAVDIKKVKITIYPDTVTVEWEVTIGPSTDGYTYESFDSRGSAGGGTSAVDKQLEKMHSLHSYDKKVEILHFNKNVPVCYNSNGTKKPGGCSGSINIQQKFYKYGKKV